MSKFLEKIILIGNLRSMEIYISDLVKEIDSNNPNEKWKGITKDLNGNLIHLNNAQKFIIALEEENEKLKHIAKYSKDIDKVAYMLSNFDRIKKENEELKKNIKYEQNL